MIKAVPRGALAVALGVGLTLGACSSSDPASSTSDEPSSSETTTPPEWAEVDDALAEMGPEVGFLAARVTDDGTCEPIHEVEASTPRPIGSQFKLFVLGALARQVVDGQVAWDQTLTVDRAVRSVGNTPESGALAFAEPNAHVTVEETATKMISISDNTATDMLIGLVGREDVEEQVREWADEPELNEPFLTTRQAFLLKYVPGLADGYLAEPPEERAAFLASSVDPLDIGEIGAGYTDEPSYIDEIEWFASPNDICRTFAGLQQLATDDALSPTLSAILSEQVAGIGLDRTHWPTVWYKGGSESGVLTLGWLATTGDGETFVVAAMVSNPDAALADEAITDLVALAEQAFGALD